MSLLFSFFVTSLSAVSSPISPLSATPEDLRVERATLHYNILGSGRPVLIVGGIAGSSSEYLIPVARELSKTYRCVVVDPRGTGKSRVDVLDTTTVNIHAILGDLELLRRGLKLDSWVVLGHSWGGMVGMAYAAAFPKRVGALVLVGSGGIDLRFLTEFHQNVAARLSTSDSVRIDAVLKAHWTTNRDLAKFEEFVITLNAYLVDKSLVQQVSPYFNRENYSPATAQVVWQNVFGMNFNLSSPLKGFKHPVLQIQGDQDPIGRQTAVDIHKSMKQSQLVFLKDCGHFPWIEQKQRFYSTLRGFLKGIR